MTLTLKWANDEDDDDEQKKTLRQVKTCKETNKVMLRVRELGTSVPLVKSSVEKLMGSYWPFVKVISPSIDVTQLCLTNQVNQNTRPSK